jgi:hypothetical protein
MTDLLGDAQLLLITISCICKAKRLESPISMSQFRMAIVSRGSRLGVSYLDLGVRKLQVPGEVASD